MYTQLFDTENLNCIVSQGATIVDQIVIIIPVENYVPKHEMPVN